MVKGRLDRKASTATGYAWFVWTKDRTEKCDVVWIPPCRKKLELESDYDNPISRNARRPIQPDLFDDSTGSIEAAC